MTNPSAWKRACAVFLLCAATAIAGQAQTFTNLVSFDGTDGAFPYYVALVQGTDGDFYGTTSGGGNPICGTSGCGTVFKISATGNLTTLYSFCAQANCADGYSPFAGLVLATDGKFYGTTAFGGTGGGNCDQNCGTVFRLTPTGTLTTLHNFEDGNDGAYPFAALMQASDGNLYGTTTEGGPADCNGGGGCGTVFKITLAGKVTIMHSFDYADGQAPIGGLVEATDGNFYGTTSFGALGGFGTAFRMTPSGAVTTVLLSQVGGYSDAGFVQGKNGDLYGTTSSLPLGEGEVFEGTSNGTLITLHYFDVSDGANPFAGLLLASDGNFYGTTFNGGLPGCGSLSDCGTLFEITPDGTFAMLESFSNGPGAHPAGGLLQATTGIFYGTTYGGGDTTCSPSYGCGTVFSLSTGLAPFVSFVHAAGKVGHTGGILGQGFTGTTNVSFNGIPASFTVKSDTFLEATVPPGAFTGFVTVSTPSGTLTSSVPFHVIH